MPVAAKAFFVVTAGVLLESPMPEHSRKWDYTSQDYEDDVKLAPHERTLFVVQRDAALAYARDLIDPAHLNWVKLEFVWV